MLESTGRYLVSFQEILIFGKIFPAVKICCSVGVKVNDGDEDADGDGGSRLEIPVSPAQPCSNCHGLGLNKVAVYVGERDMGS